MILVTAARTGVSAARTAVRLATSAGSHVAWWLDHTIGGRPRDAERKPPAPRKR